MKMMRYIILCSVLCAGSALASTIYSDSFTAADGAAVAGTAPDVNNGVSGATWAAHDTFWELEHEFNAVKFGASMAISLDIASDGDSYVQPQLMRVSATLNTGSYTTENGAYTRGIGLGFYSGVGGGPGANDWHGLVLDVNGSLVFSGANGGALGPISVIATGITTAASHTLSYEIDTSTADISNIYLDGVLQPDFTTALFGPGGRVGIAGSSSSADTFAYADNFLVEAIPEPATMGLFALFGGGLLFIRRRSRR